ncbi:uncharacterized protein [Primulina huaijiensis]|uniref:uncharacterized protein n=1 Tax=Primulina huaijiensis TaxID=1492673 RepID=UPI003CC74CCA
MSYRGRGRGRGRGGGFGFRPAKQVSFELFPEIEGLGKAVYSAEHLRLIQWGHELQKFWKNSPYYVKDKDSSQREEEREQQSYIERYSDRKSQAIKVKSRLSDYMELSPGYLPGELAIGGKKGKRAVKRVRWTVASDLQEQDPYEKLLQKNQDQEGDDKKEDENEEEDEESNDEDKEEYSDEGDYEQGEYFDDDEDDYNMPESDDDGPTY